MVLRFPFPFPHTSTKESKIFVNTENDDDAADDDIFPEIIFIVSLSSSIHAASVLFHGCRIFSVESEVSATTREYINYKERRVKW